MHKIYPTRTDNFGMPHLSDIKHDCAGICGKKGYKAAYEGNYRDYVSFLCFSRT